jgi:hypothetical protein
MTRKKDLSNGEPKSSTRSSAKTLKGTAPKAKARKASPLLPDVRDHRAISNEEIARRAYTLWEARGKPFGSADEDWHRATEQLRSGE